MGQNSQRLLPSLVLITVVCLELSCVYFCESWFCCHWCCLSLLDIQSTTGMSPDQETAALELQLLRLWLGCARSQLSGSSGLLVLCFHTADLGRGGDSLESVWNGAEQGWLLLGPHAGPHALTLGSEPHQK